MVHDKWTQSEPVGGIIQLNSYLDVSIVQQK